MSFRKKVFLLIAYLSMSKDPDLSAHHAGFILPPELKDSAHINIILIVVLVVLVVINIINRR